MVKVKKIGPDQDFIQGYYNREQWPECSLNPTLLMGKVLKYGMNFWKSIREH